MYNEDMRLEIARKRIQKKSIAAELNVSPHTFSQWLNASELPQWRKTLISEAIETIVKNRDGETKQGRR